MQLNWHNVDGLCAYANTHSSYQVFSHHPVLLIVGSAWFFGRKQAQLHLK